MSLLCSTPSLMLNSTKKRTFNRNTSTSVTFRSQKIWKQKVKLTLLVRICITGHDSADGREGDAGHGRHGSSCPHHPAVGVKEKTLLFHVHQINTNPLHGVWSKKLIKTAPKKSSLDCPDKQRRAEYTNILLKQHYFSQNYSSKSIW